MEHRIIGKYERTCAHATDHFDAHRSLGQATERAIDLTHNTMWRDRQIDTQTERRTTNRPRDVQL